MREHPNVILRGDRNECPGCGELFNSAAGFDKHRAGRFGIDRRCMTVEEMMAKGMAKNKTGFWITSPRPENATPSHPLDATSDFSG